MKERGSLMVATSCDSHVTHPSYIISSLLVTFISSSFLFSLVDRAEYMVFTLDYEVTFEPNDE